MDDKLRTERKKFDNIRIISKRADVSSINNNVADNALYGTLKYKTENLRIKSYQWLRMIILHTAIIIYHSLMTR